MDLFQMIHQSTYKGVLANMDGDPRPADNRNDNRYRKNRASHEHPCSPYAAVAL